MSLEPNVLTIHERDVTSELCQRCAKCCEIDVAISSADSRYRRYLRGVAFNVSPPSAESSDDCCDKVHDITLHLGPCAHLRATKNEDGTLYTCALYGDVRRPQLCEQYNCVSFAKALNQYHLKNARVVAAQAALNGLASVTGVGGS